MLYYNFNNYEGFKERFGIQEHGNGEKSRKNKILLAYVKNHDLLHQAVSSGDYSLINIGSMSELKQIVLRKVSECGAQIDKLSYEVHLIDTTFYSDVYQTDSFNGLCEDGDTKAVRYINHENGNVYKMKAGKFIRALISETSFGRTLPEQVLNWLSEEFVQDWQVYTTRNQSDRTLCVNDNFSWIYNSEAYGNADFHSCMVDKDYDDFYADAVKAKAAYLEDKNGKMLARCIIYTEVHEEGSDKIWRLAERQYSAECSDVLKRALVDALISGGYIDGYKQVGAGCSDSHAFVDCQGNSLADKNFWIDCELETDEAVSYQDSFKYYNYYKRRAYNDSGFSYDYDLAITEGSIDDSDDDRPWDEYHERSANDVVTVYVDGREMTCDEEDLDDFVWLEYLNEYHHIDDCSHCPVCGEWVLGEDDVYSELTDDYYCSDECKLKAEEAYRKDHAA